MKNLSDVVLSTGYLDNNKIWRKELLYKGTNGRDVERFYLSAHESYIFKPLTNPSQKGLEKWIYEQALSPFQATPKLLLNSTGKDEIDWLIFEDAGQIIHEFRLPVALEVIHLMSDFHGYPTDFLHQKNLRGQKPMMNEIIKDLLLNQKSLIHFLKECTFPEAALKRLFLLLESNSFDRGPQVFSHGDLHSGNYGLAKGKVTIIDWEHAHLNHPFWDLFHLIDMSHPVFPKKVTPKERTCLLLEYWKCREVTQGHFWSSFEQFESDYALFSAAFSIWMLQLIDSDLKKEPLHWPKNQLERQFEETKAVLEDVLLKIGTRMK